MNPPRTPDVSICIATYRRPRGLVRLLDSLARQKLPTGLAIEIVVVDNDAAASARKGLPASIAEAPTIRWLTEPRQNIAHARNRTLEEARGHWIAFIDDDEEADENWLASYWAGVERDVADGFFGPVCPRLEVAPKSWLDPQTFFTRPRHSSGTPLDATQVSTSNALVRRSLFAEWRFDPAWGRTGGEDVELFGRMLRAGAAFQWCDEAVVSETIPARRYRLRWLSQRAFNGGVGHTRRMRGQRGGIRRAFRAALAGIGLLVCLPFACLVGRRSAARVWLRACTQAGHLWAFAGGIYVEYSGAAANQSCE